MSKQIFGSQNQSLSEQLIEFQKNELQVLSQFTIDTLSPSIASMEAVQIVLEMLIEAGDYIKKNGKSDRVEKSVKRLNKLFLLITDLNKVTGELNTLQLSNRSVMAQNQMLIIENSGLNKRLDDIVKAENFE